MNIKKIQIFLSLIIFLIISFLGICFVNNIHNDIDSCNYNDSLSSKKSFIFKNYDSSEFSGIISDLGTNVAFDNNNHIGYVANDGGLTIGTFSNSKWDFTNYNSVWNKGIIGNNGVGVAFNNDGDVAYIDGEHGISIGTNINEKYQFINYNTQNTPSLLDNKISKIVFDKNNNIICGTNNNGFLIGKKSDSKYIFTNYNSKNVSEITDNACTSLAVSQDGTIAYGSVNGGIVIAKYDNNKYVFQNYNKNNTPGIASDNCNKLCFGQDGNLGYASDGGGFSIGINKGGVYSFKNYNSSTTKSIKNNDILNIAIDLNGDIAYSDSNNDGLFIGTLSLGFYTFVNYNASNYSILDNKINSIAFNKDGDISCATEKGLSIGYNSCHASLNEDNILFAKNIKDENSYFVENISIQFCANLSTMVNSLNNNYIEITINSGVNYCYVEYITKDGILPSTDNLDPNYNNYAKKVVTKSSSLDTVLIKSLDSKNGFMDGTQLSISIKYGDSNNSLSEILPTNNSTITIPGILPINNYYYVDNSFSTNNSEYIYDKYNDLYSESNLSLSFAGDLRMLLTQENVVTKYIEIKVFNGDKVSANNLADIYYLVNVPNDVTPIIPNDKLFKFSDKAFQNIVNINSMINSTGTKIDNLTFNDLKPDSKYNVSISLNSNSKDLEYLTTKSNNSVISFDTPSTPEQATIYKSPNFINGILIVFIVISAVILGTVIFGGSGYYLYVKITNKK